MLMRHGVTLSKALPLVFLHVFLIIQRRSAPPPINLNEGRLNTMSTNNSPHPSRRVHLVTNYILWAPKSKSQLPKITGLRQKTWISLLPFNSSHRLILQSNITVVVSLTYFCSHCVPFCIIFCVCIYIQWAPLQFGIDLLPWSHFLGGWLPDCITSSRHTTLIPNQPATWSGIERLFGTCLNNLLTSVADDDTWCWCC